jgi:uncharacterized repeat protein (TIGR03803 family)
MKTTTMRSQEINRAGAYSKKQGLVASSLITNGFWGVALSYSASLLLAHGQTNYQRLKSFGPAELSGTYPQSSLVKGSVGRFYGTTFAGGTNDAGTIFNLNPDASGYTVLHHFGGNGDGSGPVVLLEGIDGMLYGATQSGGTGFCSGGTIFKLNNSGSGYTVLRSFDNCGDSAGAPQPLSLIQGSDGVLYGTTSRGGEAGGTNSVGAVFRLNTDGNDYTVLYVFTNINNGFNPAALIQGSDMALYGVTRGGGTGYEGTIFRLSQESGEFTVLHSFEGSDGAWPHSALLEGTDGSLYGVTIAGGTNDGGTVFTLQKDGSGFRVLHHFTRTSDSVLQGPNAALAQGTDGTLYGTTLYGGSNWWGTAFKLNKDGSGYTVLYNFGSTAGDGSGPAAALTLGNDGAFYGTTTHGGDLGFGTVFRLFSTPSVAISGLELSASGVSLDFTGGAAGQPFRIQAATNLTSPVWQNVATNQFGIDGTFQFLDTSASTYPIRFYRSVTF